MTRSGAHSSEQYRDCHYMTSPVIVFAPLAYRCTIATELQSSEDQTQDTFSTRLTVPLYTRPRHCWSASEYTMLFFLLRSTTVCRSPTLWAALYNHTTALILREQYGYGDVVSCRYPRHMSDFAICATQVRKQDGIHTVVIWSPDYINSYIEQSRSQSSGVIFLLVGRVGWRAPLQSELLERS